MLETGVSIMFFIVPAIIILIFIFIIALIVSPKFKGKLMSNQIKGVKHMMDESKNDIQSITKDMANATKESIEITTSAIKKGLDINESIFCKYCGNKIDKDSIYCKNCGKEQ